MDALTIASLAVAILALIALAAALFRNGRRALAPLDGRLAGLEKGVDRLDGTLRGELARSRAESGATARDQRDELGEAVRSLRDSMLARLDAGRQADDERQDRLRAVVEARLQRIQDDSGKRLDEMRQVVDQRLQATLEQRLGESFRLVGDRLEQVHRGLGEMQALAGSVGDLKRVLANVKVRGVWGEQQLGNLIAEVLTPDQYAINVATKRDSADRVEFAVRLPGRAPGEGPVWLPIDAKFPHDDYARLAEAAERGDAAAVDEAARALEVRVRAEARDIRDKYLDPPGTTDFAILYLPVEGLYAEILRRPGLAEDLQRTFRVLPAGPVTFTALLNSLQVGFRTLAIERRSSEIQALLGEVKGEFVRFGEALDKVKRKIHEAEGAIEATAVRTRVLQRKLKDVQAQPAGPDLPEPLPGDAEPPSAEGSQFPT